MPNNSDFNLATIFRAVADTVPDRVAISCGPERYSFGEMAGRVERLAGQLHALGLRRGDNVGLQLANGPAYLEAMLACCRLGVRPANINYRYVAEELAQLFQSLELRGLVYGVAFEDAALAAAAAVPGLEHRIRVGDAAGAPEGTLSYEALLSTEAAVPADVVATEDDETLLCTGGTTGLPKGVIWGQRDMFLGALGGGGMYFGRGPVASVEELTTLVAAGPALSFMALAPLMHGAAMWSSLISLFSGQTLVLLPEGHFDAEHVWDTVAREGVNILSGVGDAMALPLVQALESHPGRWQLDALYVYGNGGAPLSARTKARLCEALPRLQINDGMGSSESGVIGPGAAATDGDGLIVLAPRDDLALLDDENRPLSEPGAEGTLARSGPVPRGYYGDPEKTAETFITIDGRRWVVTGDRARLREDGHLVLLGRGSQCINTGGEKVFPEEVENALRHYAGVDDVIVLGLPDERWGQRVAAIIKPVDAAAFSVDALLATGREHLAGYKLPRTLFLAGEIQRSPAGKPDYRWAKAFAETETPAHQ